MTHPDPDEYIAELETALERAEQALKRLDLKNRERTARLLELLMDGSTSLLAGQKVFLLAYRQNMTPFRSHRELAHRMGVTRSRVTQLLTTFDSELARILSEEPETDEAGG